MNHTTETNNVGPSDFNGTSVNTTNTQPTMSLKMGRSKRNINVAKRNVVNNGEGSVTTLGKRKAAAKDEGGLSVAKMRATKNRRGASASKRKGKKLREARYIHVCDDHTKDRMERAMNQPIYLIDFKEIDPIKREYTVLGPTGLVYTTTITKKVSCSCPDFSNGFHCKHILFVLLRVLKVDRNSDLIYQKALVKRELNSIFDNSPQITLPTEEDIELLKAIASGNQYKRRSIEGNCQICFDTLHNHQILIWCENGCGNNIHMNCFTQWADTLPVGQKVTCVLCRTEWSYSYLGE
ncbi:hypothetical protein Glove_232g75 [Diversispora epigaea]|uniref:SWIM-type domain-containing protein n=1 Tax=Diversispora epigaea TaxID=1348612 RepID=A0A397IC15_9GLOM|nr:hypothetical protein Glove_232g75 [Diversispora epigaea]